MSFENIYRSKEGITEITKIADFIGNLIIKNEYEARIYETRDSMLEYFKYYSAYTKTDSFSDYSISDRKLLKKKINLYIQTLDPSINIDLINKLSNYTIDKLETISGNLAKNYLSALRIARVYTYDEKNTYYRQFIGLPNTDRDIIYVLNYDASKDGYSPVTDFSGIPDINIIYYKKEDGKYFPLPKLTSWYDNNGNLIENGKIYIPNLIPIHMVDSEITPKSYTYYFIQDNIRELIEKYPGKTYLRFINTKFSSYYLRNLPNYSIIDYPKDILNQVEINYFFKAFNKARNQVIADYIDGFDKKQPLYNLLMIQNLLYYTIINYSNTYIEKFSLGIYTENNVDELLRSNGYDTLTKISDKNLKRKILQNLNELISNKANNYVLNVIMDKVLQDPDAELKRYYLEKEYDINTDYTINIDSSKGLENSVNLIFREVPYKNLDKISNNADDYKEYRSFISGDMKWGGIQDDDTDETRNNKLKYVEKKLKSINFSNILTKYITLTRTVNIISLQKKFKDYIYLMLKFFEENDYKNFYDEKIKFNTFEITPAAIFATMCWMQQMRLNDFGNDIDKYDEILTDNCIINSSVVFRKMGKLAVDKYKFENTIILDGEVIRNFDISPEIASWKIADYIKDNPTLFPGITIKEKRIPTIRLKDSLTFETINADGKKHLVNEKEDITDYLTVFRYFENGVPIGDINASTTFEELIFDYNNQYPQMIDRITEKLKNSSDFREYQAWLYLLEQSRTNNSIVFVFRGHTKFSEFITSLKCRSLINYINKLELYKHDKNGDIKINKEKVITLYDTMNTLFQKWIHDTVSNLIIDISNSNNFKVNSKYVNDMKLLFNEFLSVYSELYTIDNKISLGTQSSNGLMLQLFFNPLFISMQDKYEDTLNILNYASKTIIEHNLNDNILDDTDLNNKLYLEYKNLSIVSKLERLSIYINKAESIYKRKELLDQITEYDKLINENKKKINSKRNENNKHLSDLKNYKYRKKELQKEIEKINKKIEELNNLITIEENKINEYSNKIIKNNNLIKESKDKIIELKFQKENNNFKLEKLRKALEINNLLIEQKTKLTESYESVKNHLELFESTKTSIKNLTYEIDDYFSKINTLKFTIKGLDENISNLQTEINSLTNSFESNKNQIDTLRIIIEKYKNDIKVIQKEIDVLYIIIKELLDKIDEYTNIINESKEKINILQSEIDNLNKEINLLKQERLKNVQKQESIKDKYRKYYIDLLNFYKTKIEPIHKGKFRKYFNGTHGNDSSSWQYQIFVYFEKLFYNDWCQYKIVRTELEYNSDIGEWEEVHYTKWEDNNIKTLQLITSHFDLYKYRNEFLNTNKRVNDELKKLFEITISNILYDNIIYNYNNIENTYNNLMLKFDDILNNIENCKTMCGSHFPNVDKCCNYLNSIKYNILKLNPYNEMRIYYNAINNKISYGSLLYYSQVAINILRDEIINPFKQKSKKILDNIKNIGDQLNKDIKEIENYNEIINNIDQQINEKEELIKNKEREIKNNLNIINHHNKLLADIYADETNQTQINKYKLLQFNLKELNSIITSNKEKIKILTKNNIKINKILIEKTEELNKNKSDKDRLEELINNYKNSINKNKTDIQNKTDQLKLLKKHFIDNKNFYINNINTILDNIDKIKFLIQAQLNNNFTDFSTISNLIFENNKKVIKSAQDFIIYIENLIKNLLEKINNNLEIEDDNYIIRVREILEKANILKEHFTNNEKVILDLIKMINDKINYYITSNINIDNQIIELNNYITELTNKNNELNNLINNITNNNLNNLNNKLNVEMTEKNKLVSQLNTVLSKINELLGKINLNNSDISELNQDIHYLETNIITITKLLETNSDDPIIIKPEDPFDHILSITFGQKFDDSLLLKYKKQSNIKTSLNDNLNIFKEQLKITDNLTGETKYYA